MLLLQLLQCELPCLRPEADRRSLQWTAGLTIADSQSSVSRNNFSQSDLRPAFEREQQLYY